MQILMTKIKSKIIIIIITSLQTQKMGIFSYFKAISLHCDIKKLLLLTETKSQISHCKRIH